MRPSCADPRRRKSAFTLVEMLVSMAVFAIVGLVLAGILEQSSRTWQRAVNTGDYRQRARTALNFISRDLRNAALPLDRSSQVSLRFQINPSGTPAALGNADALFWQAPVATDSKVGNFAEIGYCVRWTGAKAALYRLFLNPSDAAYSGPTTLGAAYDPNKAILNVSDWSPYFLLDNVIGMWVTAYDANGKALASPGKNTYDSRTTHALPTMVTVSLVVLDAAHAVRLTAQPPPAADADTFLTKLPAAIKGGAAVVSLNIRMENAVSW